MTMVMEKTSAPSAPEENSPVLCATVTKKKMTRQGKKGEAQVRGLRYPNSHQLFVGNIPHDVEEAKLKEVFEKYGTVLELIIKNGGKFSNFGFVVFNDSEPVQNILSDRPIKLSGDWRLNVEEMTTRPARSDKAPATASPRWQVHGEVFLNVEEASLARSDKTATAGNGAVKLRKEGKKVETPVWGVKYPDTHQVFVGKIPHDVDEAELKELFEQYGTVMKLSIKCGIGKQPNFGFVAFNDAAPVQSILSNRPIKLRDEVQLNVEEMKANSARSDKTTMTASGGVKSRREGKKGETQVWGVKYPDTHQLFVGNIPHEVDEAELKELFEQYGTVMKLSIKCGGKLPNFGFVAFNDAAPVQSILSDRPIKLRGEVQLNVEEMKASSARPEKAAATTANGAVKSTAQRSGGPAPAHKGPGEVCIIETHADKATTTVSLETEVQKEVKPADMKADTLQVPAPVFARSILPHDEDTTKLKQYRTNCKFIDTADSISIS